MKNCKTKICIVLLLLMWGNTIHAQQKKPPIWEAGLQYPLSSDTTKVGVVKNLNYSIDKNEFTTLDIYAPTTNKPIAGFPVVLLIHGGPVSPGIPVKPKDWKVYINYGKLVACNGVAVVTVNHRVFDSENISQSRNDLLSAINFIKKNAVKYKLDSNSIALWMFSMGGRHFDYFANKNDSSIKAMISSYGTLTQEKNASDSVAYRPAQLIVRCGLDKPELLAATDSYISKAIQMNYPVEIINHSSGVHAFDIFQNSGETINIIDKAIYFLRERLLNH